jgi:pimeloyl-ACP methyl ester carboxylesterase
MKNPRWLRMMGITLATLLVLLLVGPFLIAVPAAPGTVPPEQLADLDSQFIQVEGLSIHLKTMGGGQPVFILLHGFGASLFSWHEVMEPFSRHGLVIAYDRPAFGLTERPVNWTGLDPYSPEANLLLLASLMDHYHIQQAILVGNSAGGTLAMQFALKYPERVQALILVDPAVDGGGVPPWVRLLGATPQMRHLGPLLVRSIQRNGLDIVRRAWYDPSRITQVTWDGYTKPLKADNWDRALWNFTMSSREPGLLDRLTEFNLPIMVITGEDDRIVPTAGSIDLAGNIPGAKLAVIPQAGHVPHEEQPAAFMQAVESFLQDLLSR